MVTADRPNAAPTCPERTMEPLTIDLQPLINECQRKLLESEPVEITYVDRQNLANNELPLFIDHGPVNVYALWIKAENGGGSQCTLANVSSQMVGAGLNNIYLQLHLELNLNSNE